jgi:MoaA/NifB/PqqE/SkfB family radical SAM enzyme
MGGARLVKSVARSVVGALSPALLHRLQLSRARRMYLRDPVRGPRRVLLEPTTGCNHRCVMCWDHSPRLAQPTGARHMPFDRVSSLLREMAEMGTEEVWLAGRGDPLVHPKAPDILQLIGSLGMRSIITTNGGLLTDELADRLCEWGLQQLSVSIDSGTPETYQQVHGGAPADRARILSLTKRLAGRADRKPRLLVSMVLSQLNFRELLALVRDATEAGATGVVIGGMRPVPFDSTDLALSDEDWARVRDDLAQAQEMAREAGVDLATDNIRPVEKPRAAAWPYAEMACFIGHLFAVIDVDGVVHGCCTCQNRLGSLDAASFRDIWWSRQYALYRRILRDMPSTGLTPPRCECRHGCGHVPENAQLQREFSFRFPAAAGRGLRLPRAQSRDEAREFATRLQVAEAICRHLDGIIPARSRDFAFADLSSPGMLGVASRLRQLGIMSGIGSMDGVSLFEPQRMVAREEFEEILLRALLASEIEPDRARSLITQSRAGTGHPSEPLSKRDMTRWLSQLAAALPRS